MGTAKPAEGKAYEAINASASPGLFARLGFTKKRVMIGAIVIISFWFLLSTYKSMGSTAMGFVHADGEKVEYELNQATIFVIACFFDRNACSRANLYAINVLHSFPVFIVSKLDFSIFLKCV